MADPKHPRHYEESFKRQIVQLYENGKPARGLEDAVAALETGAAVMDPADPTNMAVTAAESGRSL